LVVTKLDRLARSVANLVEIEGKLRSKGAALQILTMGMDTATAGGRLQVLELLSKGVGPSEVARKLGIGRQSVYRILEASKLN
jgi:DNA invertase Pin-like site-specific DNA recombinase